MASKILGGWRVSAIQLYSSGSPLALGTTISFPVFNTNRPTITTYDGWQGTMKGSKFDPYVDSFFQPASFFGTQPTDRLGNMTRYNPKIRQFPNYQENVSLAKRFAVHESLRLDFRFEGFNIFNRARFGALSNGTSLQNPNFGLWRAQLNDPRRLQLALKLYW